MIKPASLLVLLATACTSTDTPPIVSAPTTKAADTTYIAGERLVREIRKEGRLVERTVYEQLSDTLYGANGRPLEVVDGAHAGFDTKHTVHHPNGRVQAVWEQGAPFGCGMKVGEELTYDSLGHLLTKAEYAHDLPKGAAGCHQSHTVTTTTAYHANGQPRLRKQEENFYESEVCPCGTWEHFDEQGTPVRKEEHGPCTDDKLECG